MVEQMLTAAVAAVPWLVVLIVYIGEKWQQVRLTRALEGALTRAQAAQPALPAPAPASDTPPTKPAPAATPSPAKGPFDDAPDWFKGALKEIGFHETGSNQGIDRYIAMAHAGANGDPWCAIFSNAMLEQAGVKGTRSASSQSFRTDPNFTQISAPVLGCIVVFWRISKASGQGHVGFYRGEDATHVWTLGGNENDMVQIEALPKDSATFGLIGYFWPKAVAMPTGGPVLMPAGSPVSIKTAPSVSNSSAQVAPGVQTGITATVFTGDKSAYGPPIDDNSPGVALPFRFSGERPKVRVTGMKTGKSVDCDIVDVGPWNINDPYWEKGARPQAESGVDEFKGRKTNKAGIDLTLAAANAIGLDGKGLVSWSFLPAGEPRVI